MERFNEFLNDFLPVAEKWLRAAVRQEVEEAIEADRQKKRPPKMYTRDEVCQLLNISKPTLWHRTKSGDIKATHVHRRVLYSEEEINRVLGK